jgi:hypothetical protein
VTGKNVPENRNIGTIANRWMAAKPESFSSRAATAVIGAANASPVSSADGRVSTTSGLSAAPNATSATRNSPAEVSTRNET